MADLKSRVCRQIKDRAARVKANRQQRPSSGQNLRKFTRGVDLKRERAKAEGQAGSGGRTLLITLLLGKRGKLRGQLPSIYAAL